MRETINVAHNLDVVILSSREAPSIDQFDTLIRKARRQAKVVGVKRSDVKAAVVKVCRLSGSRSAILQELVAATRERLARVH